MGKTEAILVELNEQSTFPACWRRWSGWGWRLTNQPWSGWSRQEVEGSPHPCLRALDRAHALPVGQDVGV